MASSFLYIICPRGGLVFKVCLYFLWLQFSVGIHFWLTCFLCYRYHGETGSQGDRHLDYLPQEVSRYRHGEPRDDCCRATHPPQGPVPPLLLRRKKKGRGGTLPQPFGHQEALRVDPLTPLLFSSRAPHSLGSHR